MAYQWATWLADVLRGDGLVVVEHDGWRSRGQNDGGFEPRALMFHHDASAPGPSPNLPAYLADLSHPGAQCWVDTAGRWHLIAAGRMWHAGAGGGWGAIPAQQGNTYSIGVETDHTTGEAWPPVQLDAIRRGMAAICRARGWDAATAIAGHKEYAPGRKDDPDGVDLPGFRRQVAALITYPQQPEEDDMTPEQAAQLADLHKHLIPHGIARGQTTVGGTIATTLGVVQGLVNTTNAAPAKVASAVEAAVAKLNIADVDPAALATAVVAELGRELTAGGGA